MIAPQQLYSEQKFKLANPVNDLWITLILIGQQYLGIEILLTLNI